VGRLRVPQSIGWLEAEGLSNRRELDALLLDRGREFGWRAAVGDQPDRGERIGHGRGMTGRFIIALPVSVLDLYADLFSLKRLPVELPIPQLPIAIVTLKNRTLSPTVQLLIECAREVTKSMAAGAKPRQTNRFSPQRIGQHAEAGARKSPT